MIGLQQQQINATPKDPQLWKHCEVQVWKRRSTGRRHLLVISVVVIVVASLQSSNTSRHPRGFFTSRPSCTLPIYIISKSAANIRLVPLVFYRGSKFSPSSAVSCGSVQLPGFTMRVTYSASTKLPRERGGWEVLEKEVAEEVGAKQCANSG